jgi:heme exporter protein C
VMWRAVDNPDTAADLTSVLCIVGSIFAVLSRYAVNFWNQGLHQGASLSLDKEKNVADVFYQPLLFSIGGFVLLFFALVLLGTRAEIRMRRAAALRMRHGLE